MSFYEKNQKDPDLEKLVKMDVFGPKWSFLDCFLAKMAKTRIFRQNPKMSLPYTHEAATLCKKLEKSYERILRSSSEERTDGRTRVNS